MTSGFNACVLQGHLRDNSESPGMLIIVDTLFQSRFYFATLGFISYGKKENVEIVYLYLFL